MLPPTMGLVLSPVDLVFVVGFTMSCCRELGVLDAGAAALEGGLHGRLYGERRGGGGGLALRSFGWRGAGGGSSWSWR
jgi:hypothetical protein